MLKDRLVACHRSPLCFLQYIRKTDRIFVFSSFALRAARCVRVRVRARADEARWRISVTFHAVDAFPLTHGFGAIQPATEHRSAIDSQFGITKIG